MQQILWKSVDRFRKYSPFCISQCLDMEAAILLILSRDQNRKILIYRIWFMFCTRKLLKLITLYIRNAYWTFTDIILYFNGCYFDFCNSEVMTSLPHNLVLDSQPRFGLAQSKFLNLNNFLIN